MGGGTGGSNDSPPPAAPPGTIGNPPPKMKPYKYFDGAISSIANQIITVEQHVAIPGEKDQVVTKKFTIQSGTEYEPTGYTLGVKDKVRVLYDIKGDDFIVKKVIKDKNQ